MTSQISISPQRGRTSRCFMVALVALFAAPGLSNAATIYLDPGSFGGLTGDIVFNASPTLNSVITAAEITSWQFAVPHSGGLTLSGSTSINPVICDNACALEVLKIGGTKVLEFQPTEPGLTGGIPQNLETVFTTRHGGDTYTVQFNSFIGSLGEPNDVVVTDVTADISGTFYSSSVPEPATLALLGLAVVGFGVIRRRERP